MIWLWVGLAVLVLALGALIPVLTTRRRHASNDEAIAARSRQAMLAHYIEDPAATDDERAAALLRQARERWNTAGEVLARAESEEDFLLAERIAEEGLGHVASAHARIGLPVPVFERARRRRRGSAGGAGRRARRRRRSSGGRS